MLFTNDRMESSERLEAIFSYKQPDRVPLGCIDTGFCCVNAGFTMKTVFENPEKTFQAKRKAEEQFGFDPLPQIVRHTILAAHDFGGSVRLPESEYEANLIIEAYPFQSEEGIEALEAPDIESCPGIVDAMEFSKIQSNQGLPVWFHHRSPFTMASNLCGIETFLRWLYKRPDLCLHLIKVSIDHIFNALNYWVRNFGSKNIRVFNSSPSESNQLISPKHFDRFVVPSHEAYYQRLNALGVDKYFWHICGDQNQNLNRLVEIANLWPHPSILSFGHEVDIETAGKMFSKDIIFGNINPVFLQIEKPNAIYEESRKIISAGKGCAGGFVFGPGCDIPPYAPANNVMAMAKAVSDFGYFSGHASH